MHISVIIQQPTICSQSDICLSQMGYENKIYIDFLHVILHSRSQTQIKLVFFIHFRIHEQLKYEISCIEICHIYANIEQFGSWIMSREMLYIFTEDICLLIVYKLVVNWIKWVIQNLNLGQTVYLNACRSQKELLMDPHKYNLIIVIIPSRSLTLTLPSHKNFSGPLQTVPCISMQPGGTTTIHS